MVRFRIFGVPVQVHASFLLIVVLGPLHDALSAALWLVAAFVAIVLHELGHSLAARGFGAEGVGITLYGLGGLTSYRPGSMTGHARSFVVSAAGSAVGIAAGLAIIGLGRVGVYDTWPAPPVDFLDFFVFVALVWGVLNWVPIVPLDGGHMVLHLVAMIDEKRAPLIAQVITWVAVAVIVPLAIWAGYYFAAAIVVFFAFMGFREYRDATRPPTPKPHPRSEVSEIEDPADPPPFPI
ncbi:MAG: site-2 protease family protein [Acidimicrobiia bacterium]|nr:site-2 protease family protein [Acidimicrobiia bacterium]